MGEVTPSEPIFVTSPTNIKVGAFARACQASYLMGRVITHRDDHSVEPSFRFKSALQLHRTVKALLPSLTCEFETNPAKLSTAMALCYSTLLELYDLYACASRWGSHNTVDETVMQGVAIDGAKSIVNEIYQFGEYLRRSLEYDLLAASPLVCDCLHQCAATFIWLWEETAEPQMKENAEFMKMVLGGLRPRWRVAGE